LYDWGMSILGLTTDRLALRPFSLEDLDALHDILQQPGIFRYFPHTDPPTRERVARMIAFYIKQGEDLRFSTWAVVLKETGNLIGWCGLNRLPETGEDEVAYLMSQAVHGKGYATEGAQASLAYGFSAIGLERIIALVHPENIASQRVAEKCGMSLRDRVTYWGLELLRYERFPREWKK